MHFFLYIINGSGLGKSWTGFYACNRLRLQFPNDLTYSICIDFSNGSRYIDIDSHLDIEVSFGLRVASCFLNVPWLSLYEKYKNSLSNLKFNNVMEWFSKQYRRISNNQGQIFFGIHLDEIQLNSTFSQKILHIIASFMCRTVEKEISDSSRFNIVVFPILTGTSSKNLRMAITDHGSLYIDLRPFTLKESFKFLNSNIPNFNCEDQNKRFQRTVMSMGGIPRLLERFAQYIKSEVNIKFLDHIITSTKTEISCIYQIGEFWMQTCQTIKNVKMIIAMSISGKLVDLTTKLPDNELEIEDVVKGGIIFLKKSPYGYYITYPLLILEILNECFNFTTLNLMEPLSPDWSWNKFVEFEAEFERLKNNSYVTSG
ncbi:hypothetical protein DLAC_07969 [Tieghemostelium lacteum]|uniref:Uncharacterized protein n=1 Tax=Tieghemostelium lacteum TaxID=361077 RepID=A0A151ZAU5_TIELA|nr:hypothetical protein DLAC_07969 [Tieghemostelium lacteum]|eukprot:KYQ91067.1 hypothetical protein DLAC_07969 [Tieghemostelium lacteum]